MRDHTAPPEQRLSGGSHPFASGRAALVRITALALLLLLGACAERISEPAPLDPAAMPVSFTAAGLKDGERTYREMRDPRTGRTTKRMTVTGRSTFAIVDFAEINQTGAGFVQRQTDSVAGRMLGPHWTLEPGSSERLGVGGDPVLIHSFMASSDEPALRGKKVACVSVQRFHDRMLQSEGPEPLYQAAAVVVYCQLRSIPMDPAVAREVADKLVIN